VVEKALEKGPENRYQSMRDMVVDLRRLARQSVETPAPAKANARPAWTWAASAALALVVALGAGKFWPQAGPPHILSIAVLPLQNLSGDPNQEYFSDGTTEELISNLAQIHALKVISRTTVMRYKGTTKPLPEIGREFGVDAILEGSVRRSEGHIRISAQLIQTSTDAHLWAKDYDRDLSDVLKL